MSTVTHQRRIAMMAYFSYIVAFYFILFFKIEPFVSHSSTFGLIGNLLAMPMYWIGIKIHTGERRWPWIWFAATGVLYFIGDALWAYHADWIGIEPESPSVCDLFYLLNSYTCCCAFICYIRQIREMDSSDVFFDILISVAAMGGLLYRFIILPLIHDPSVGIFSMFFHANMTVIDLALFTGILGVIFGTARRRFYTKRTLLLGASFFACCLVEQLSLAIEVYALPIGSYFDPFWATPFWLFALTSTYPDEDEADQQENMSFHMRWGKLLEYSHTLLPYFLVALILLLVGREAALKSPFFAFLFLLLAFRLLRSFCVLSKRNRREVNTQKL